MDSIKRKEPQPMDVVIKEFIREMKLTSGLNTQRIFAAWDEISGAAKWTTNRFFKDGVLYITMNSSVARNHLVFQLPELTRSINDRLMADPLFVKDDPKSRLVTRIILK